MFCRNRVFRGQRVEDLIGQRSDVNLDRLQYDMGSLARMMQTTEKEIVVCDMLIAKNSPSCAVDNKALYLLNMLEYQDNLAERVLELLSLRKA